MNDRMTEILAPGRVAVITGAAKGIGAALAVALARKGMKLALLDVDAAAVEAFATTLPNPADVITLAGDVASPDALQQLRDRTLEKFGDVALLVNNAGIAKGAGPWDARELWQRQMDVNFNSIVRSHFLFVPGMIASGKPGAIVNLGSKEGITTPPGNAAYSVAKAGVKVVTEQLSHELIKASDGRVSAHLLVPGYTWTPMNFPGMDAAADVKPPAPWTAEELVEYFLVRLGNDDFYIICPDNDVTPELDAKRIRWAADDMVLNRPALSRWHPDFKDQFADYLKR